MNSRKRLIYSLLALLLAGGCKILGERKVVNRETNTRMSSAWRGMGILGIVQYKRPAMPA